MSKRLTVLAPAFYPSRDRVRYFLDSAARHGLEPRLYGIGEQFADWIQTHVIRLSSALLDVDTPLVLVTDSADVLFNGGEDEILAGWEELGCPALTMGVELDGQVNAGGWLAETPAMSQALVAISSQMDSGDPQVIWRHAISAGKVTVKHDHRRRIFYVDTLLTPLSQHRRLPPVLHFPGGYSDQLTGRDYRMKPLWEELYGTHTG